MSAIVVSRARRRKHAWIDRELRGAASKQFGLIDKRTIDRLAIRPTSVRRRVNEGLLLVCHPGVYRFASSTSTDKQQIAAALLAAGPVSVAIGRSAALLHGLKTPFLIDINIPPNRRLTLDGVRVFRKQIAEGDITKVSGLRVTTIPRTVLDLAAVLTTEQLEIVVDEILSRRLVSLKSLIEMVVRNSRLSGAGRLAIILELRPQGTALFRSLVEREINRVFTAEGLGGISNFPVIDADGQERSLDRAWPDRKISLEHDSFRWHTGKRAWANDRNRANALVAAGWRLVVSTDADMQEGFTKPMAAIRKLLAA
jgi:hypothetical protein